ncbi:MAG: 3-deoxy-7-phosphoheptulonate synthase [Candidatus Sumerlaeia bacterium]|nr:3-deoxy-7-phosphoheptulonate synthase [Candidatus Sumerlaeia bacterium]
MIIVMKKGSTAEDLKRVEVRVTELGYRPHPIVGVERTIVGAVGHEDKTPLHDLEAMDCVEAVIPILRPYKLVSREFKPEASVLDVAGVAVGGRELVVMAGPCSVESRDQILKSADAVAAAGAQFLRGGAFKPRTSPYAFQGLRREGLELLAEARKRTGLRVVTEVVSVEDVPLLVEYADVLQIGARNCQNYALLAAVGETRKPVLFKRGMATTIKEYLQAAEYILDRGNYTVLLCERGIRTFETATRNTLDLNAVPVLKRETHLPVIVDPSHGTGYADLVPAMARAAVAAGADGLMIEMHPNPSEALSDGPQSLGPADFEGLMRSVRPVAEAVGRALTGPKQK